MKTDIKFLLTTVATSAIALIAATKIEASYLPVAVSYVAVATIVALAVSDYRVAHKGYAGR